MSDRYDPGETARLVGKFSHSATVIITITKLADGSEVVSAGACSEIGSSGYFQYNYLPLAAGEYLWSMSDGVDEVADSLIVSISPWGAGIGIQLKEYTLLDGEGNPAGGIECWATSDTAGVTRISPVRLTNDLGKVIFQLDVPVGTHVWIWHRGASTGDEEVV